jgi:hypothetical protein
METVPSCSIYIEMWPYQYRLSALRITTQYRHACSAVVEDPLPTAHNCQHEILQLGYPATLDRQQTQYAEKRGMPSSGM